MSKPIPKVQTAALVHELGGEVRFEHDYPVPELKANEVLAKVLYTGVCQSGKGFQSGPPQSYHIISYHIISYPHLEPRLEGTVSLFL